MQDAFRDLQVDLASAQCVLLVHPDVRLLQTEMASLSRASGWPLVSLGRSLSAGLLSEPPHRRPPTARGLVQTLLEEAAPGPVLCADIDLLFDPSLELDPLALFRNISRTVKLVVAWPGTYTAPVLSYAVPEHAHHRFWRYPQVAIRTI